MANFCGGIRLDSTTLKIIDGVICDANAASVDRSKAVSTCGQLWDGALFTVVKVGGASYITLHGSEGEEIGAPVMGRGNCGVGLDGRFFKIVNGAVTLQNGFVLTVNATPLMLLSLLRIQIASLLRLLPVRPISFYLVV